VDGQLPFRLLYTIEQVLDAFELGHELVLAGCYFFIKVGEIQLDLGQFLSGNGIDYLLIGLRYFSVGLDIGHVREYYNNQQLAYIRPSKIEGMLK